MGRFALAALLLSALPALAQNGTVAGTLTLVGQDGKPTAGDATVVVYIPDFEQDPPSRPTPVIEERNKSFVPSVLPVVKGEKVTFLNMDPFLHNVFSTSPAAKPRGQQVLDLGREAGPNTPTSIGPLRRTGIIDFYCDIHEQMVATVLVLPNAAFAVLNGSGKFTLKDVPAGHHVLYAWSRDGKKASADFDLAAGKTATVKLDVAVAPHSAEHKDKYGGDYKEHPEGYSAH